MKISSETLSKLHKIANANPPKKKESALDYAVDYVFNQIDRSGRLQSKQDHLHHSIDSYVRQLELAPYSGRNEPTQKEVKDLIIELLIGKGIIEAPKVYEESRMYPEFRYEANIRQIANHFDNFERDAIQSAAATVTQKFADEGINTIEVNVDISGSMQSHQKSVYDALTGLANALEDGQSLSVRFVDYRGALTQVTGDELKEGYRLPSFNGGGPKARDLFNIYQADGQDAIISITDHLERDAAEIHDLLVEQLPKNAEESQSIGAPTSSALQQRHLICLEGSSEKAQTAKVLEHAYGSEILKALI